MAHHHPHASDYGRAFAIGVALNTAFVAIEVVAGLMAHSLALLSDAGHNLGDVAGLLLSWGALRLGTWKATTRHTYGFQKASILAALSNALLLLVAIGGVSWEAVRRLTHPLPVASGIVMAVAVAGLVVNATTALLFMKGRHTDLNIRSAFLHMMADAVISAGVAVAGWLMLRTGWLWIDPAVSLVIGITIFAGTWTLLREAINLMMDAVPEKIDAKAVEAFLLAQPGVVDAHHLHIWGLSTTHVALTVHLVVQKPEIDNLWLDHLREELHHQYGIMHATIQVESPEGNSCLTEPRGDLANRRG